ncbi:MAG: porin family protein [Bacteroidaceae bacterium]|nr:porin family protein [Bacteroidaceae bacterium]
MARLIQLILILLFTSSSLFGQKLKLFSFPSTFQFEIKAGFNSSTNFVDELSCNHRVIEDNSNFYKIGYSLSAFMIIPIVKKHFIETGISYTITRGEIMFSYINQTETEATECHSTMASNIRSFDFPILYGYKVIDDKPYVMTVFGGPKIKYNLKRKYKLGDLDVESNGDLYESIYPFNVSLSFGIGVYISHIYINFAYDIGLHNICKELYTQDDTADESDYSLKRRNNVISFSCGYVF